MNVCQVKEILTGFIGLVEFRSHTIGFNKDEISTAVLTKLHQVGKIIQGQSPYFATDLLLILKAK